MDARLLREDEVDLRAGPVHLDARHRAAKLFRQRRGLEHAEECAFGIGVGQDHLRRNLGSILERHASRAAFLTSMRATGADVRISAPNLRAAEAMACVIAPMPPMTWP